ncbi:MAG TPA: nuclease-related domain-containing protein [Anaerolineales bacterium]|nr:nuclease-related domain-containing protein [Anaerolineales bacterium]
MKIIDKTPFVNKKGEMGLLERVQAMLKFGFNWPNEWQAQNAIAKFFEHHLERGYSLIRNLTLGDTGIMIPMILIGPAGVFVIYVAYLRGRYEAKGEAWNVESGGQFKPAPVNLIQRTAKMARALETFLKNQGVEMPVKAEPVLIAGDPGLHIESNRPAIRVLMIDGVRTFVNGLLTARPVLTLEAAHELTERILNPRPPKKEATPVTTAQPEVSRARAIFNASQQAKPFNPADFDFMMTEEMPAQTPPSALRASVRAPARKPQSRRILGMTPLQLALIAALSLCLIAILAAFAIILIFFS